MDNRSDIWLGVDAIKPRFVALSDRVWAMPEVCYTEARSAAEHLAELRHQAFRITENVADIPTALMGEWGEGGPVIAFLGEYDALPGLSQEAGVAEPRPLEAGGHGHGCGHNLLGSAALLAATAVKDWLAANKAPGRVRYYGCPAEDGGAAKTFMVRSGAFADADIAITWHPNSFWEVAVTPSLAHTRAAFIFKDVPDDIIGNFGLIGGGAAGIELDCITTNLGSLPNILRLASSENHNSMMMLANEEFMVVPPNLGGDQNERVKADLAFGETPSGGAIFATSSIAWCGSLSHNGYDNNVSRICWNVLQRFADPEPFKAAF